MEAFQVNLSEEELKRLERQAGGKPEEPDSSIPNEEKPRPSIDLQRLRWWDKPSEKSKFQFFLYLKTMISAGFPFLEAIENSSSPEDDPIFHEIVQDVVLDTLTVAPYDLLHSLEVQFTKLMCGRMNWCIAFLDLDAEHFEGSIGCGAICASAHHEHPDMHDERPTYTCQLAHACHKKSAGPSRCRR